MEMLKSENINFRWFAVVGDNGYSFTRSDGVVLEGVHTLRNVTVFELPNEEIARNFAVNAYTSRFFMRNHMLGISPAIPINLPADEIYYDSDFDAREGSRNIGYFPGLLI